MGLTGFNRTRRLAALAHLAEAAGVDITGLDEAAARERIRGAEAFKQSEALASKKAAEPEPEPEPVPDAKPKPKAKAAAKKN